jgi:hypothetical protein
MKEEKLKQILNEIGRTDVPENIASIAELASQRFDAVLNINRPQRRFLTPVRLLAAAAVIILAFAAGRWSKPVSIPQVAAYKSTYSINTAINKKPEGFWHQKALAAMQPRPYARTSFDKANPLNSYKQYLKEKYND